MVKIKHFKSKNLDYILLGITLVCVIFGIIAINTAVKSFNGGASYVIIQTAGAILGFVMMFFISSIDYNKLGKITKFIYGLCVLSLIAVLVIGTGREDTGSKSWIRFGPIGIQPSEFVKIGFIITFSKTVVNCGDELNKPKNILKLLLHAGVFVFLIMLQPDFGTMMVFAVIFAGILFVAKISWIYVAGTALFIAAAIPLAWNFFLADYQKNRIRVLFNRCHCLL